MKRLTLLLLLAVSLPISAHADDASRHAKAAEMVSLLHMDRVMGQMMDNMMKQTSAMTQQMAGANMTPAQAARITDFQRQMFGLIDSKIGWKTLEPRTTSTSTREILPTRSSTASSPSTNRPQASPLSTKPPPSRMKACSSSRPAWSRSSRNSSR